MQSQSAATDSTLRQDVHRALRNWHAADEEGGLLTHLCLYRRLQRQGGGSARRVTNGVLLQALEALSTTHEDEARVIQARFLDREPIHRLANRLNVADSTVYVVQRQAIDRLVDQIRQLEEAAVANQTARLLQRLEPSTYTELVGADHQIDRLAELIVTPTAPWLIAIEGIGGIGKTALADALLRRLIVTGRVDEVAWVSARQQRLNLGGGLTAVAAPVLTPDQLIAALADQLLPELPADTAPARALSMLRARLQALPHLIVVDNLETVLDVENLLPALHSLANPTKFLLTSRQSFYGEPNLYHLRMPELDEPVALRLIRQEARLSNLSELAASSDAELIPIVETVGGNPLALRLVVGQAHLYTLPSILYELRMAQGQPSENLYEYIYRKAWSHLDPLSRQALLIMPLGNPAGEEIEFLAEVGDLAVDELRTALSRLVMLNLVDARGGLYERRYSIHSLTRTFLQQQVARWF